MAGGCTDCGDSSIPQVNNEAKECCELVSTNCVVTSKYQDFFKIGKGKTLTYAIDKIAKFVKKNKQDINDLQTLLNYRSYVAILNQVAGDDPTANIITNQLLGGTPVLARTNPGKYTLTLAGAFTANKTTIDIKEFNRAWGEQVKAYWVDVNTIAIESGSTTDFINDDVITNMPIEIKVYN